MSGRTDGVESERAKESFSLSLSLFVPSPLLVFRHTGNAGLSRENYQDGVKLYAFNFAVCWRSVVLLFSLLFPSLSLFPLFCTSASRPRCRFFSPSLSYSLGVSFSRMINSAEVIEGYTYTHIYTLFEEQNVFKCAAALRWTRYIARAHIQSWKTMRRPERSEVRALKQSRLE